MPSLVEEQARFIACLQKGPKYFPGDMFIESADRALLGLKAHANTISHARLVALENAYPKLHEHIGHEDFNAISRDYVEQDVILTCDMNNIAAGFADFLVARDFGGTEVDLARIEWAWIESYHSAEAEPLTVDDISTLDEQSLLAFEIAAHPAMRLITLTNALSPQLSELGDMAPCALMVARPEAEVLFHPLDQTERAIAGKIANIQLMGNLLEVAIELGGESAAMGSIITFIQAGAIIRFRGVNS